VDSLHNGLIAQMAPLDQALLLKKAELVHFKSGELLASSVASARSVFFLISGSVSLFVCKNSVDTSVGLAVGLVGSEGAVGLQSALGLRAGNLTYVVQSPGSAYVLDSLVLQRLIKRQSTVLLAISRYLWTVYESVAAMAAMSQSQDVRMRFAHWLQISFERSQPDPLVMTHAFVAQMLGVRRASVSLVARELKLAGVIGYSRGHVNILQHAELKRIASGGV
jgi:CRP-like cAMP-binding protein